jgi:hypothetical protein
MQRRFLAAAAAQEAVSHEKKGGGVLSSAAAAAQEAVSHHCGDGAAERQSDPSSHELAQVGLSLARHAIGCDGVGRSARLLGGGGASHRNLCFDLLALRVQFRPLDRSCLI